MKKIKGFSIVEVLIIGGVLSIMTASMSVFLKNTKSFSNNEDILKNYKRRFKELQQVVNNGPEIILSYTQGAPVNTGNALMQFCAIGAGGGFSCPGTAVNKSTQPLGFILYKTRNAANTQGTPVAGPQNAPIRYRPSGEPCAPTESVSPRCPFEAISQFWANCAGNAPSCPTALDFSFVITLRHALDATNQPVFIATGLPPFGTLTYTKSINRNDLINNRVSSCENGLINSGWNSDGTPICSQITHWCASGTVFAGFVNGKATCKPVYDLCKSNQTQVGFDGNNAICQDKDSTKCANGGVQIGYESGAPKCTDTSANCWTVDSASNDNEEYIPCTQVPGGIVTSRVRNCTTQAGGKKVGSGGKTGSQMPNCITTFRCCTSLGGAFNVTLPPVPTFNPIPPPPPPPPPLPGGGKGGSGGGKGGGGKGGGGKGGGGKGGGGKGGGASGGGPSGGGASGGGPSGGGAFGGGGKGGGASGGGGKGGGASGGGPSGGGAFGGGGKGSGGSNPTPPTPPGLSSTWQCPAMDAATPGTPGTLVFSGTQLFITKIQSIGGISYGEQGISDYTATAGGTLSLNPRSSTCPAHFQIVNDFLGSTLNTTVVGDNLQLIPINPQGQAGNPIQCNRLNTNTSPPILPPQTGCIDYNNGTPVFSVP